MIRGHLTRILVGVTLLIIVFTMIICGFGRSKVLYLADDFSIPAWTDSDLATRTRTTRGLVASIQVCDCHPPEWNLPLDGRYLLVATEDGSFVFSVFRVSRRKVTSHVHQVEYEVKATYCVNLLWPGIALLCLSAICIISGPVCRWNRLRNGRCWKCGYDLRGTNDNRCPECGTEFQRPDSSQRTT